MLSAYATHVLAIVLLVLLAVVAVVLIVRRVAQRKHSLALSGLYFINRLVTRLLWRTSVSGRLPVPPGQGAVVVSNHTTSVDPLFIQVATDRPVHWMVAREYVNIPVIAAGFRVLQIIPVNRGGIDTASTRAAIRYTKAGDVVGIFPEGRINLKPREQLLMPGRPGAALVALKAQVPIVPCYVSGAPYDGTPIGPFFMPARVHVKFGNPIDVSEFFGREREEGVLQEITLRIMREIAVLAGQPDFVPQLAGKRWKPGSEDEIAA